jgi:glycosyltransferase involved in cell wall biosynthesis
MQPPADRLRVGFSATLFSTTADYRAAGIHGYIRGLLTALAEEPGCQVTAFGPAAALEALPGAIRRRPVPAYVRRRALRIAWEQLALPWALARTRSDLVHGPAYAVPLLAGPPAVATVHDLSFERLPETFGRGQAAYLRLATRTAVRRAAALIAVSEFTRRELVALLGASAARVHVVPNGVDAAFRPATPAGAAAFRERVGLPERYLLTVGTLQPRKNLGTLLEAYALLRRAGAQPPDLVVAGAPGWGEEDPRRQAAELGLAAQVHFTGFVPAAELPALYGAAALFACPSRYEGFGLPVLEAMACGTPVVVADAGALPEVAGEAGLAVGPDDVAGWAAALGAVLADPARAGAMAEQGLARAAGFSWPRAARETLAVYREVAAGAAGARAALEVNRGPA